jgi:hypothetical protein
MAAPQLAVVLAAATEAVTPARLPFVMDDQSLTDQLSTDVQTQRKEVFAFARKQLLDTGVLVRDALGYSKLERLMTDPRGLSWTSPACNSLPDSKPGMMDWKLGRVSQPPPTRNIREAMQRFIELVDSLSWHDLPTDLDSARRQYLQFVALRAVFVRVLSALQAARAAAVSLSESLALYRAEGDLIAPMPYSDLLAPVPPMEERFPLKNLGVFTVPLLPAMQNGLWALSETAMDTLGLSQLSDRQLKLHVIMVWSAIVWGSDYVNWYVMSDESSGTSKPPAEWESAYLEFASKLRTLNGFTDDISTRQSALDGLIAALRLEQRDGHVIVAPSDDPVKLISHVLADGLLFARLNRNRDPSTIQAVHGPFIAPDESICYLAHHTSDTRHATDPSKDKFSWILASAAVGLRRLASPPAYPDAPEWEQNKQQLHARLRSLAIGNTLPSVPEGSREAPAHGDVAGVLKASLSDSEMRTLARFILRAEQAHWGGYATLRSNLARYTRVRAYYDALTNGMGL